MSIEDIVDHVIEAPIVTSFTNIGYQLRSRLHRWPPLDSFDMTGRTVIVTGANRPADCTGPPSIPGRICHAEVVEVHA